MTRRSFPNSVEAQVASLWASGHKAADIVRITGSARAYVGQVVGKLCANTRFDIKFEGDDNKHLGLILAKHGTGFPYFPRVPI